MYLIDRYRGALLGLAVGDALGTTLEDTETTPEELAATFGAAIRDLVQEVTDDKRLPTTERRARQAAGAPGSPTAPSGSGLPTRSPTSGMSPTIDQVLQEGRAVLDAQHHHALGA